MQYDSWHLAKNVNMRNNLKKIYRGVVSLLPKNMIVDRLMRSVSLDSFREFENVNIGYFQINKDEYRDWVQEFFPLWKDRFSDYQNKKLIEFYTSYTILNPKSTDTFCDAAGGVDTYLPSLNCEKKYLQDYFINAEIRKKFKKKVQFIEGNAERLPLPDKSLDKISCHHSIEHFQKYSDSKFIVEIQRLLKKRGKCCIIPIIVSNRYTEVTDALTFEKKFDQRSRRVIDPTASIPGGRYCGNYARVYDLFAFRERILDQIDSNRFKISIFELRMDGEPVPEMSLKCHKHVSAMNHPYRALVLECIQ